MDLHTFFYLTNSNGFLLKILFNLPTHFIFNQFLVIHLIIYSSSMDFLNCSMENLTQYLVGSCAMWKTSELAFPLKWLIFCFLSSGSHVTLLIYNSRPFHISYEVKFIGALIFPLNLRTLHFFLLSFCLALNL